MLIDTYPPTPLGHPGDMTLAGALAPNEVLTRYAVSARPECPISPDGRHCQSATGAPICQFCGAPM
ncbi:hypothetical protein GCM10010452_59550 [Crossiella cryophila]|uniref:Uncharacterized protein n=1 Tax=Crossiella cryophila TaxID=43355 RepID=A0A7W7FZ05_9PSEU|nr:hypothetical protein [Crossiella cryophila]